jgi:ribosomal-protein-alanine N-acetyltransferase
MSLGNETVDDETVIETERLRLRRLNDDDWSRMYDFYQDAEVMRFLGPRPESREEFVAAQRQRWSEHYRDHGWGQWAMVRKDDGAFAGRCGLIMQHVDGVDEVEVGYALGREFWGSGYAGEAAIACRDWAFRNLDVSRVISLIAPGNTRSQAVARRNGMAIWKDAVHRGFEVNVWRITREEWARLHP